jgi:uncharacterized membrane protein (UPF0127 family)
MPSFLTPLLTHPAQNFTLHNERSGRPVASELLPAFDSAARRKGLLGRDHLARGTAIVIAPTNAIHTWFMRFPIDVAFVAKDGRVVKVRSGLGPWRMAAAWSAYAVVEMAAGELVGSGTKAGDQLLVLPRPSSDK